MDVEDPRGDALADVLGASLLRNVVYRRLECGAPWGIRIPGLDRAMFYVLARGSTLLEIEGEPVRTLSAGDVALVAHGTPHVMRDSTRTPVVPVCDGQHKRSSPSHLVRRFGGDGPPTSIIAGFFLFGGARKTALLASLPRCVALSAGDASAHPWVAATVQLMISESASPGPASALVLQRLADVLLVQVLRALSMRREDGRAGVRALADPPIHEALGILHAHVASPWTVARLAAKVGLSRSAFAARFSELVGEPPLQYLARWRMARAAELLRETDDGVGAIAERVGYESVPSFTKAFKRWQGQSPGAFRRSAAAAPS